MAENTTTLVTLDNLADHTDEIKRILQQVRAYIDKQDSTKVDKVSGKGLSTNDLTTELLNKLNSLDNYDDTTVRNLIKGISSRIDTLVGESATEAIDNFNEILSFLNGVTDTQTLQGLLAKLKSEFDGLLANKVDKVSGKQLSTNDYTTAEKTKLSGIEEGAQKNTVIGVKGNAEASYRTGNINITPADIGAATTAVVTTSSNGLMSSTDKTKLDGVETGAQKNTVTGIRGNAESSYRTGNVNLTPADIGAAAASHTHAISEVTDLQATLNGKAATNHTHKMSEIIDLDIPTYETLTLTVTAEDGSSVEGQKATINGKVYPLDSTGVVVVKIPYGVVYSISLDFKIGYIIPKELIFAAILSSREVSVVYKVEKLGVFIQDKSGELWEVDMWESANNANANAIAVKTANVKVLVALTDFGLQKIHSISSASLENYMTAITEETMAKVDYSGVANTDNIIKLQASSSYAAGLCKAFTFPDGTTKGHLPSAGEFWEVFQNKDDIDKALAKCGGVAIDAGNFNYYWTSTFWGINEANKNRGMWAILWNDGNIFGAQLADTRYTRAFGVL